MKMRYVIWATCILALDVNAGAVGKAWDISPSSTSDLADRPAWPRLDSSASGSAFEVRSVSGVGRIGMSAGPQESDDQRRSRRTIEEFKDESQDYIEDPNFEEFLRNRRELDDVEEFDGHEDWPAYERVQRSISHVEDPLMHHFTVPHIEHLQRPRIRRDAEMKVEKISGSKSVREARLNSPETWSKQPISVEFRRHSNSDQTVFDKDLQGSRGRHAPKADFVTGHRRDLPESRESREMPALARAYPDYVPLFQEKVRERDFDVRIPRRYQPDRDYDPRRPSDTTRYYSTRYNEEDVNPYGRAYTPSKPKRIIYYAHLPEVTRKPVDLRSYRYPYDDVIRSPPVAVASSTMYNRAPGNVDPNGYRYRTPYPYDAYVPYRRDPYKRPYEVPYQARTDEEQYTDRAALKEDPRSLGLDDGSSERSRMNGRESDSRTGGRLPWPVQIGTEVNIKDDERIPGRRIFGKMEDYNRYQVNAKLQADPSQGNSHDDDQKSNN